MRTTLEQVTAAIGVPLDCDPNPFMVTANRLVSYIVGLDTAGILAASGLDIELETYLACFFLALKHQKFASKTTGDASAQFQVGQSKGGYFDQNDWGRAALALDPTGELRKLNAGVTQISFGWLGTPNNQMQPWWMRDPISDDQL